MKKLLILIGVIVLTLLMAACGEQGKNNEKKGVPEQQLLADLEEAAAYTPENIEYMHHVDEVLHTDSVYISYDHCFQYVTVHKYLESEYQYNMSTDIWTWISGYEHDAGKSLNSNIENAEFNGSDSQMGTTHGISYHIIVTDVDYEERRVTISYNITWGDTEYTGETNLGIGGEYTVERYVFGIRFDSRKGLLAEFDDRYD